MSAIWNFVRISDLSGENHALLRRVYKELMIPNFPNPDELDVR